MGKKGKRSRADMFEVQRMLEPLKKGIESGEYTLKQLLVHVNARAKGFTETRIMLKKDLEDLRYDTSSISDFSRAKRGRPVSDDDWVKDTYRRHRTLTKKYQRMNLRFNIAMGPALAVYMREEVEDVEAADELDALVSEAKELMKTQEGGSQKGDSI